MRAALRRATACRRRLVSRKSDEPAGRCCRCQLKKPFRDGTVSMEMDPCSWSSASPDFDGIGTFRGMHPEEINTLGTLDDLWTRPRFRATMPAQDEARIISGACQAARPPSYRASGVLQDRLSDNLECDAAMRRGARTTYTPHAQDEPLTIRRGGVRMNLESNLVGDDGPDQAQLRPRMALVASGVGSVVALGLLVGLWAACTLPMRGGSGPSSHVVSPRREEVVSAVPTGPISSIRWGAFSTGPRTASTTASGG